VLRQKNLQNCVTDTVSTDSWVALMKEANTPLQDWLNHTSDWLSLHHWNVSINANLKALTLTKRILCSNAVWVKISS
jgi:hypothetical protein